MKQLLRTIISLACCLAVLSFISYQVWSDWVPSQTDQLTLTMLNVGQGDAIYIRTPTGVDVLIDGGPDRSVLAELGAVMPLTDRRIDYVIATHPDADHITGLTQLAPSLEIGLLLTNGQTKSSQVAVALEQLPAQLEIPHRAVERGQRLQLDDETWLECLSPDPAQLHPDDSNADSIVCILHYRSATAMLTGDATVETEQAIITAATASQVDLDVDLLKVAHHGSHTSTSPEWLRATSPEVALISVGASNHYGHPHAVVLYWLEQFGAEVWRSDQHGRVVCQTAGQDFSCHSS